jgi:hypothetical protein
MQRVHQNDLVGYLQEQGGFEILNLPASRNDPGRQHVAQWNQQRGGPD